MFPPDPLPARACPARIQRRAPPTIGAWLDAVSSGGRLARYLCTSRNILRCNINYGKLPFNADSLYHAAFIGFETGAPMAVAQQKPSAAPLKDLYDIGEVPPLGHVPANMHAWAIRKDRHGPPEKSMQHEVVPTWPIGDDEALVYVMAGGVNYNG